MEDKLIEALLAGNWATVLQSLLTLVILTFCGTILKRIFTELREHSIEIAKKVQDTKIGRMTEIDDRFFEMAKQALANWTGLENKLIDAASDGVITQEEWEAIGKAGLQNLMGNIGAQDWKDFGWRLLGSEKVLSGDAVSQDVVKAVERKFIANLPKLTNDAMNEVRMSRAMLKAPLEPQAVLGNS